ncbi:MAG: hypothetical protein JW891_07675 [Candidatus Lokiarchaeota archaeon]|nr:hypothetical protein [Candidatus Lokiarchaeota archaeon]
MGKGKAVHFHIKNPNKSFLQWSDNISVKDWFPLWERTEIDQSWNQQTKK